jgi:hypothetical protein
MLRTRLDISAKGGITTEFPKNGKRGWLKVKFVGSRDELWISAKAARQLHAQLSERLAELDADAATAGTGSAAGK